MQKLNSRYVFVSSQNLTVVNGKYVIDLGLNPNRPPYEIISLVEGSMILDNEINGVILKSNIQASNYYSDDNESTAIGFFHFSTTHGTDKRYELSESGKSQLQCSNVRYVEISPRLFDGSVIALADITGVALLFKIDYPEVGEIQGDYVKSIQKAI